MLIKRKSVISGIERAMDIPVHPEDMAAYILGSVNIQEAMPYLSDVHREFIISGITKEEWDSAFSDDPYASVGSDSERLYDEA